MKKNFKNKAIILVVLVLGIAIGSNGSIVKNVNASNLTYNLDNVAYSNANVVKNKDGKNVQRIVNKQVEIEYIESDGLFDILITPKKNFNVSSEFENKVGENYSDFYIAGISEEKAKEFYQKNDMASKGIKWTWNK